VILEALGRLIVGRTTFMIAHRLSTVRDAARILVLDHGRLVEQGTHEELMGHAGLYHEMYRAQNGRDGPANGKPPPAVSGLLAGATVPR
jgi:ABC-type multidrug transport system fused ATPase/permease subunit